MIKNTSNKYIPLACLITWTAAARMRWMGKDTDIEPLSRKDAGTRSTNSKLFSSSQNKSVHFPDKLCSAQASFRHSKAISLSQLGNSKGYIFQLIKHSITRDPGKDILVCIARRSSHLWETYRNTCVDLSPTVCLLHVFRLCMFFGCGFRTATI